MSRIVFTDASVTYPGGLTAMKNIDLTIEEGEFVVIVGLSGAGKSTLLRSINGLVPVTGSVTVDGREVVDASHSEIRAIRSDIGMIFQKFQSVISPPVIPGLFILPFECSIFAKSCKQTMNLLPNHIFVL